MQATGTERALEDAHLSELWDADMLAAIRRWAEGRALTYEYHHRQGDAIHLNGRVHWLVLRKTDGDPYGRHTAWELDADGVTVRSFTGTDTLRTVLETLESHAPDRNGGEA